MVNCEYLSLSLVNEWFITQKNIISLAWAFRP